ncbi:MAG: hypothetical protein J6O41_02005, partial [Clostridia bacterium]|nr:hypothetical protein [Clostridia bacterium]
REDRQNGTVVYVIERGIDDDNYVEENLYKYNLKGYSIYVEYDVEDVQEEGATKLVFNASSISKGYTQTYNANGITSTQTTITGGLNYEDSTELYLYAPDTHAWANMYLRTEGDKTSLIKSDIENFLNNDKLNFCFRTGFSYVSGNLESVRWTITNQNKLTWYDTVNKTEKSKTMTSEEMYVKEIKVDSFSNVDNAWIKFYKVGEEEPFFTATQENLTYTVPDNMKIGEFYAVANNPLHNNYNGWTTKYEISASKMMENGLSEENIRYMRKITESLNATGSWLNNKTDSANLRILEYEKEPISYFRIAKKSDTLYYTRNASTLDASDGDIGLSKSGNLNLYYQPLNTTIYQNNCIVNTNPTFYIILPNQFDYEITSIGVNNLYNKYRFTAEELKLKSYRIKKVNDTKVLEVQLEGKYENDHNNSNNDDTPDLSIAFNRTLKSYYFPTTIDYHVYMKTVENKYYSDAVDNLDLDEDGDRTNRLGHTSPIGYISINSQLKLSSMIYDSLGELKTNANIKVNPGETVKYRVQFDNDYADLSKLELICRLPFEGNKSIIGESLLDLESNFSLVNLDNYAISTLYKHTTKYNLSATIQYSSDAEAGVNSEFLNRDEIDLSTVKTIKITINASDNSQNLQYLKKGSSFVFDYEMDVPTNIEIGKQASQISAAKYYKNDGTSEVIESAKSTVTVGDPSGTIQVKKVFTNHLGRDVTNKNVDKLKDINFRIVNMDDESIYYDKTTDANGYALFENVPVGDWKIVEITQFDDYEQYKEEYVTISNGEQYTEENGKCINIQNRLKTGRLIINKVWDGTELIQKNDIGASIVGTTLVEEDYQQYSGSFKITTDENGQRHQSIIVNNFPYGRYTVQEGNYRDETSGLAEGWHADSVNIDFEQDEQEVTLVNKPKKGTIEIRKTVPEGDSVKDIKFRLFGTSIIKYLNEDGREANYEVYEEATTDANGIARFENIICGEYTIEEIDIPEIETPNGIETRYKPYSEDIVIDDTNAGRTIVKEVKNEWKTGNLNVIVTANGGTNLSLFKVKVEGTSYYGENISREYNVPESGNLLITDLSIGKYTVTECNTKEENGKIITTSPDGFEVTYTPEDVTTNGVVLKSTEDTTVRIHNEFGGIGYNIKIEKTLE